jgi:hypothetical protein
MNMIAAAVAAVIFRSGIKGAHHCARMRIGYAAKTKMQIVRQISAGTTFHFSKNDIVDYQGLTKTGKFAFPRKKLFSNFFSCESWVRNCRIL